MEQTEGGGVVNMIDLSKFAEALKKAKVDEETGTIQMSREFRDMLVEALEGKDYVIPIRCKSCKHKPIIPEGEDTVGYLEFPRNSQCPCQGDMDYSWYPGDDWFCANGEPQEVETDGNHS